MKTVKFVKLPGEIREFGIDETTTVRDILDMAGESVVSGMSVMGDDEEVSLDDYAENYNLISVTKKIKGNK